MPNPCRVGTAHLTPLAMTGIPAIPVGSTAPVQAPHLSQDKQRTLASAHLYFVVIPGLKSPMAMLRFAYPTLT
jgi:hypothetical protein